MTRDSITGSLIGVALGDAFGAPYEGGPLERLVWRLIGRRNGRRRWTDDTSMSLDVAESMAELGRVDQDDLAQRFARSYAWSRGYGPGAAKVLRRIRGGQSWRQASVAVYPSGSYGNGGAMRAPVVGAYFAGSGRRAIVDAAELVAEITHAHLLGIEGAQLVALAAASAARDDDSSVLATLRSARWSPVFDRKLKIATSWSSDSATPSARVVARELGNGIEATESAVTAIYAADRFLSHDFEQLLAFCRELRGDVDTIGAIAGGIWGARRGVDAFPAERIAQVEASEHILTTGKRLKARAPETSRTLHSSASA